MATELMMPRLRFLRSAAIPRPLRALLCLAVLVFPISSLMGQPVLKDGPPVQAPPSAPPLVTAPDLGTRPVQTRGSTLYSIGEPTDEEQLYLEYINRARMDPVGEATRLVITTDPQVRNSYDYWGVDTNMLWTEIAAEAPDPPLSFDPRLIAAARLHSGDMYTNQFQGHTGSASTGFSTLATRLAAQGYAYTAASENVYSFAEHPWHGHAGFEVDWGTNGPSLGGMQFPRGHRNNIHSGEVKEIGIGVVNGVNGSVGPQLITQDFASRSGLTPFVTGVAFFDLNTNGFYDLGEGIGGVRVDVDGSVYYAVTSRSGGYSIPVAGSGSWTAHFSAPNLPATQRTVSVTNSRSAKLDLVPAYEAPMVSGPSQVAINTDTIYTFAPVPAATAHRVRTSRAAAWNTVLGAESGLDGVSVETSGDYSVRDTRVAAAGGLASYHLAHSQPEDQFITIDAQFLPEPGATLSYASRLGWASTNQIARVQVSVDDGVTWQSLYSQAGTGGGGELNFVPRSHSLASFVGRVVRIRFLYDYNGGSYFYQTDGSVAWHIDNITLSQCRQISDVSVVTTTGDSFTFHPTAKDSYLLEVRGTIDTREFPYSPPLKVSAVDAVMTAALEGPHWDGVDGLVFEVAVANGTASTVSLQRRDALEQVWVSDGSVAPETVTPGIRYRFRIPTTAARGFYRVAVE